MTETVKPSDERSVLTAAPGFYPGITPKEYFAEPCPAPALSASGIKTLLNKTPADFAYEHPALTTNAEIAETNAAQRLGDVCHQLALGKGRGFAVGDFKAWQSNDAKQFKADAEAAGLTPVKRAEYEDALVMAEIMKARIVATLDIIGAMNGQPKPEGGWKYETEVVFAWIEETPTGPIWCRAMADVWCEDLWTILDPKFSKQLYPGTLERHMPKVGWDLQSAFYARGIERLIPGSAGRVTFANLLVHPDPPHISRAVKIEEAWRYSAQLEIERAICLFSGYLKANVWPGFPSGIETLNAPPWLIAQRMDATAFDNGSAVDFGDDDDGAEDGTDGA